MESTLKTAAAYIRVSTHDQEEYSPESQKKLIREYAKNNGYLLPEEFIFQDDGISGRKAEKRPSFMKMISIAKQPGHPFDVILVWKFSRFARNQEESIVYKSLLRKENNVDIISISEPLADGPFGSLIERIIEWTDEYYSIRLSGEVKRGMTEKVTRGEPVAAPSFGYRIENKQYIVNPDTAPIVKMIFQDFISGVPYQTIARKLNDMGIRTKRGGLWEHRTVEYVIRNPIYIGKIRWNPDGWTRRNYEDPNVVVVDSTHEPIIDKATWEAAQARAKDLKAMYGKYQRTEQKTLSAYQGLVKCSTCGSTLSLCNKDGMQCIGYVHAKCKVSHYISQKKLDAIVTAKLAQDMEIGKINLVRKAPAKSAAETVSNDFKILREKKKLERIQEAYESGDYSLEDYRTRKQKVEEAIAKLEAEKPKELEDMETRIQKFYEKQKDKITALTTTEMTAEEKNKMLRTFVDKIVFDRASCSVEISYYD